MIFCFFSLLTLASPTVGLIPQPASIVYTDQHYRLTDELNVQHNVPHCFTLHAAIKRFRQNINLKNSALRTPLYSIGAVTRLVINVTLKCNEISERIFPTERSRESYNISIANGSIQIMAPEVWGAMYGLTTLTQLVLPGKVLQAVQVVDFPRWSFRSFLIDSSRHFLPRYTILQFLDAMATVKMNVLHWHITDDDSFPYESYTFPLFSDKGAFSNIHATYTQQDVQNILEYARALGIRVMPEFDTPGHTLSWGLGYPELLTRCHSADDLGGRYGPINPINDTTYSFIGEFIKEITDVFPDTAVHLGGDEVDFECWKSNPEIRDFMQRMGYGKDYRKLEAYFFTQYLRKINEVVHKKDFKGYVWQDVFDNGVELDASIGVHIWKDRRWRDELYAVTKSGREAIFSSCWYLNYIKYAEDWIEYYRCDPGTFTTNVSHLALLKGGGAAMWGEFVDETNLISRSWPRGAVVAERLWSPGNVKNIDEMRIRLSRYRCFLLKLGFDAEPSTGPGFCDLR